MSRAPVMHNKLYIANLPFDTTEEALRRHFASCGGVLQVDLPDETQRGKIRSSFASSPKVRVAGGSKPERTTPSTLARALQSVRAV